jgi:hypothetical protein
VSHPALSPRIMRVRRTRGRKSSVINVFAGNLSLDRLVTAASIVR